MPTWFDSAKDIAKNAYCQVAGFGEWYAGGVATLLDETRLDELAEFQLEYAQWANRKFCGKSPASSLPPYIAAPFTGGQCIGVDYEVGIDYDLKYPNGVIYSSSRNGSFAVAGAIYGVGSDTLAPLSGGRASIFFNTSRGKEYQGGFAPNVGDYFDGLRIWIKRRYDGLPDNCGNPPVVPKPPSTAPFVIVRDIPYDDDNGNPAIDTGVTFTFETPIREPDGTISIPYTICKGGFCVKGKVNLGDELRAIDESPSEDYLTPIVELDDPVGEGTATPESELDGEPLSEADKEKTPILGVFIKAQKDGLKSKATEVFLEDNAPAILVPNIGYVRFRILHGDESGWLADIPIKSVNAYIPVPDKLEAVSCEVAFQAGWKGQYIAHRGNACCKECEESDD